MLSGWRNCCSGISQRWIFTIMSFLGLWIGNALRVIISITITEMVVPVTEEITSIDDTCASVEKVNPKNYTLVYEDLYTWDEYTQGIILSSYFWGYAATQFVFGVLSERYGGKYLLGLGILIPGILTFFTPLGIEKGGYVALIVLRVLMGGTSGSMYPAASAMISKWATLEERSKFGTIIYAGAILGTVFGTTMPAIIIRYSGMGWPAVFHFFGVVGILWFPFWVVLCYNNPDEHPYISEMELQYIDENSDNQKYKKIPSPPWKHIMMSKPFWAFVMALIGIDWAYFTMANDLPKYMSSIVKFSIEDNGYLSSLPYLGMWFNSIFSGWLNDTLVAKGCFSLTNVRKILASISLTGPAIFLVAASYAECDQVLVVVMFVIGIVLMGSSYTSVMVNALDLSPNYAGTLMSIGNGIAAIGGVLTPYIVGILTPNQTVSEWRIVFWVVFVVSVLTNVHFLIYASSDVQEWNDPDFVRDKQEPPIENEPEKSDKKAIDVEIARF